MELRHLRYFVVTAEELHFTRAAARLNIGQPPLSQQIRDLEKEIGVELFQRLARRVQLTAAGRSFLVDARAVLELAERARVSAQQFGRGERGSIRVGFTSSASFNPFVPAAISLYRTNYPGVQLALDENVTSTLVKKLQDGQMDVAFLRPTSEEMEGLRTEFLFKEAMILALPKGHRLAEKASVPIASLASEALVMYPRANGTALYDTIIASCRNAGFSPRIAQEAPQMSSTINLVAAGLGVAIVPESMRQLHPHGVVYKTFKGVPPFAPLSLACKAGSTVSATVDNFMTSVIFSAANRQVFKSKLGEGGRNAKTPSSLAGHGYLKPTE